MILTRFRKGRAPLARRLAAFLALLGVLGARVEHMIPDVHDGDATPSETIVSALGGSDVGDGPANSQHAPESAPVHLVHVDHCGHAHMVSLGAPETSAEPPIHGSARFDTATPFLSSVSLSPHSRPPIA